MNIAPDRSTPTVGAAHAPDPTTVLAVSELAKRYPPALDALRGISLEVAAGEVVALLGANGAGKSTLTKLITGVERATAGRIVFCDEEVAWESPAAAQRSGIAAVHQELPLLPNLSAAENVFLGTSARGWAFSRRGRQEEAYRRVARLLPAAPPPEQLVGRLSVGDRQKVALIRALALEPRLLVLDEGTSSVSAEERAELQQLVRDIARSRGIAVLFITHFIADALAVSDRVVVLRDGRVALADNARRLSEDAVVAALSPEDEPPTGVPRPAAGAARSGAGGGLTCRGLRADQVGPIDIDITPGSIVGLYGHPGCGASELLRAIAGVDRHRGELSWAGRRLPASAHGRVRRNVVYCSGDRARNLISGWTLKANVQLLSLFAKPMLSFPSGSQARTDAERVVNEFGVLGAPGDEVRQLSGGNQQKIAVARAMLRPDDLLLLGDDLTRGVDVVGRARIHEILRRAVAQGAAIVLYSTDPDEIAGLCSRVLLLEGGVVIGELSGEGITPAALEAAARTRGASHPAAPDDTTNEEVSAW
jgi:ABC-type sugar transport system ATPase subunit